MVYSAYLCLLAFERFVSKELAPTLSGLLRMGKLVVAKSSGSVGREHKTI